jgi:hypothetical protein
MMTTTNHKLEIRKVLVLSTGHLTEETGRNYDEWPVIARYDEGFYVYVGAEDELPCLRHVPDDLGRVVEFAKQHQCAEIKFDCDAEIVEELPVYDW